MDWIAVGNYLLGIILTILLVLAVLHFASAGRIWNVFSTDKYKCGMVQILSSTQAPDLTGLYASSADASTGALSCNVPQAFYYDDSMCTLNGGKYVCTAKTTTPS